MLSVGEWAQAVQADKTDFMPTTMGGGARSPMQSESVTQRAVRSLVDTEALRHVQQQDPFLQKVRLHLLHGEVNTDRAETLDSKSYLFDDRGLVWYAPGGGTGNQYWRSTRRWYPNSWRWSMLCTGIPVWPLLWRCWASAFTGQQ